MTRSELITSEEYFAAVIALELWRQAGNPTNFEKYETQAKKVAKKIMPIIEEIQKKDKNKN